MVQSCAIYEYNNFFFYKYCTSQTKKLAMYAFKYVNYMLIYNRKFI